MSRSQSLRRKVFLALFGAIGLAIGLSGLGLAIWEFKAAETRAQPSLETLAASVFVNAETAVQFGIPDDAVRTLATLGKGDQIVSARLFRREAPDAPGLFAQFVHPGRPSEFDAVVRPDGYYVAHDHALLVRSQAVNKTVVATLQLEIDLASFRRGLGQSLAILAVLLAVLLAVGAILGRLLQRAITRPILQLAETAAQVHRTGDYRLRATAGTRDEVGRLAEAFNAMLASLEQRDSALRRSEEQLRALIAEAADGIFIADAQGVYLDLNPSFARMLGWPHAELIGRALPDTVAPEDHPLLPPALARLRAGESVVTEWHFRRQNGALFSGEVSAKLLADGRLLGTVRDITERKQVEAQMRAQLDELSRWHDVTLGREERVLALKREVNELLARAAQPLRYPSANEEPGKAGGADAPTKALPTASSPPRERPS
jgi:PAS domain S-box-containing protein